jgi:hypothetical protein
MLTSLWNSSLNFLTALDPVTCAVIGIGAVVIIGVYFFFSSSTTPSLEEQEEAAKKLIAEIDERIFTLNQEAMNQIVEVTSKRYVLTNEVLAVLKTRIEKIWAIANEFPQYNSALLIANENIFVKDFLKTAQEHLQSDFWKVVIRSLANTDADTTSLYFMTHLDSAGFYAFYQKMFTDTWYDSFGLLLIEYYSFADSYAVCLLFSLCIYILKIKFYQPSLGNIVTISFWFYLVKFTELVKQVLYYNRHKFSDYNISLIKN